MIDMILGLYKWTRVNTDASSRLSSQMSVYSALIFDFLDLAMHKKLGELQETGKTGEKQTWELCCDHFSSERPTGYRLFLGRQHDVGCVRSVYTDLALFGKWS